MGLAPRMVVWIFPIIRSLNNAATAIRRKVRQAYLGYESQATGKR
jgi:hypothetical protein